MATALRIHRGAGSVLFPADDQAPQSPSLVVQGGAVQTGWPPETENRPAKNASNLHRMTIFKPFPSLRQGNTLARTPDSMGESGVNRDGARIVWLLLLI